MPLQCAFATVTCYCLHLASLSTCLSLLYLLSLLSWDAFPLLTSSMPLEKHTTTCESCGKTFKLTGIGPHHKLCIRQAHKMNEDHTHFDLLH
ncbi:hypothetical protein F5J12DRAFT_830406 [Pisolithus orientalis]|uniref:uncharacterized protein n=1 Tax=Pisolithus orientalis TaxID=936130 RepID=UPI0022248059|nr:uncharacterized protein F5J12DRAFT_830406 [Pisolithus orientalis]KAI6007739.1 hypothetical protein F5J12DRAFT_830406 [Pisolithus orientalis]